MVFNAGKFELLRFCSGAESFAYSYLAPDQSQIKEKKWLRDLGVLISSDLSFTEQIEAVAQSASQIAGWALRTFRGRGKVLMLTVLKSLIHPRLEYCSELWSPKDQYSINKLEKIQANFISRIREASLQGLNYWEKLSQLSLYSLERRRERSMICLLWKISQGLVSGYNVNWTHSDRRGRMAVPHSIKMSAPSKVRNAREKSVSVHAAKLFNLLPLHLRNENSGDFLLFKNNLDIFLKTVPDQPTMTGLARAAKTNSLLDQIVYCT